MKVHANAPLGPKGRSTMVLRVLEEGWSLAEAAEAAGVSERTCSKWVVRYRAEGEGGLRDRSSAPKSIPHRTPDELVEAIAALRRLRMTGAEIALCLTMALSTVSAVLQRIGLGKLSRLEPPEPPNRYERETVRPSVCEAGLG
jgi:transposase